MTVTQMIALSLAAAVADPSAGESRASLGASATVIRPAEISAVASKSEGEVVIITRSGEAEMAAEGGTLTRLHDDRWIVRQAGAAPVVVTLTY
jgi:hypothetical protein